jgi:zinc transport system substrate-binding protein
MLVSPGASSVHAFEPSPQDIITMVQADVFVYTGGHGHMWVDRIINSFDTSEMRIMKLLDYVETVPVGGNTCVHADENAHSHNHGHNHNHNHHTCESDNADDCSEPDCDHDVDEHVWGSPANAIVLVQAIADMLSEVSPEDADYFQANAASYIVKLQEVHEEIASVVENSELDRIAVADIFPFRYFVEEYDLCFVSAFPGCSDQADPSPRVITELIEYVEKHSLPYVFHTELSNQNVARIIAEHTGAGMLTLYSTQTISREDFENGITYVDLMRRNAEALKRGLKYQSSI